MAAVNHRVKPGSLSVEWYGLHKGVLQVTFDDGRVRDHTRRAANATEWQQRLADIEAEAEVELRKEDAVEVVVANQEINGANKSASEEDQLIAYLRGAALARGQRSPKMAQALRTLTQANNYITRMGWTYQQVLTRLMNYGYTQEEWDEIRQLYLDLTAGDNEKTIADYNALENADWWKGD